MVVKVENVYSTSRSSTRVDECMYEGIKRQRILLQNWIKKE